MSTASPSHRIGALFRPFSFLLVAFTVFGFAPPAKAETSCPCFSGAEVRKACEGKILTVKLALYSGGSDSNVICRPMLFVVEADPQYPRCVTMQAGSTTAAANLSPAQTEACLLALLGYPP